MWLVDDAPGSSSLYGFKQVDFKDFPCTSLFEYSEPDVGPTLTFGAYLNNTEDL